jgi:hypothetical protein
MPAPVTALTDVIRSMATSGSTSRVSYTHFKA